MKSLTLEIKRSILVTADWHCGSVYGLMPPGFVNKQGNGINQNAGQVKIWSHFKKVCAAAKRYKVGQVWTVGDLIQGNHKKKNGANNVVQELDEQTEIARLCLARLAAGRKVIGVAGTDYHGSIDSAIEKTIIKSVDGEFRNYIASIDIEGSGHRVFMSHKSTSGMYKGMPSERDVIFKNDAFARGKIDKFTIMIRAHSHVYRYYDHDKNLMVPCFTATAPDEYTSLNWMRWQSDIGAVILLILENDDVIVRPILMTEPIRLTDFEAITED